MNTKKQIKELLLKGGKITPMDALQSYGCFRLGSIIHRLRQEGLDIITVATGKQRYATYFLGKPLRRVF